MEELTVVLQTCFETAKGKEMLLPGPLIQEKAGHFARELGIGGFKVSKGWLQRFRG